MNIYGAICKPNGKYRVVKILPLQTIIQTETRTFDTFEEADQVARDIAYGKYEWLLPKGNYISMR